MTQPSRVLLTQVGVRNLEQAYFGQTKGVGTGTGFVLFESDPVLLVLVASEPADEEFVAAEEEEALPASALDTVDSITVLSTPWAITPEIDIKTTREDINQTALDIYNPPEIHFTL